AQAEMDGIAAGIAAAFPDSNRGWGATLDPLRDRVVSPRLERTVLTLFAAALFILVIACANVANLTLTRLARRPKEIAIRASLGATGRQLAAQFLTESLVLSMAGGVLGFVLGRWLLEFLAAFMTGFGLPPEVQASADRRVALFTLGLSLLSALIFGMAPAW